MTATHGVGMFFSRIQRIAALLAAVLLAAPLDLQARKVQSGSESELAGIQRHYDKREVLIPMRDGVRLFTAIYTPKDTSRAYPILLQRTPYGVSPYGEKSFTDQLGPSAQFQDEGFIFVYQDVRGRMMSEGEFVNMRPQRAVQRRRRG